MLEDQIQRCFLYSERTQEAKKLQQGMGGNCSPPAGKKHRECVEMKELMDGLRLDLEGKVAREGTFDEVFATDDPRVRGFYDYNFAPGGHP